ncbi:succinoglycan biosynthesis transport protein ExoP [Aliiruegeria haliotis]|uniref:Succinoglycan biosynthesis transport protein ExoP n=1 Tax=Aliiruegeria haliotis TaxID=1280846 RepID=A0A2T0S0C7_9RHOB|nr:hypothetical protein [Aliiruegeria haliotis]PRY26822.1 succinoglycan biosynthesis transport protein ExoP [Aliiruegeria haliotis]
MDVNRITLQGGRVLPEASEQAPMFDFGSALRVLKRRSGVIVFVTSLFLGLGFLAAALGVDRYTAGSTVLLEAPSLTPFGGDDLYKATKFDNVTIESQMQVIRSPLLLSQVVEDLNLSEREIFWEPRRGAVKQWILDRKDQVTSFAAETLGPELAGRLGLVPAEDPLSDAELFQAAVRKLRDDIAVTRNGVTSVLGVKATANSAELAADIANAVTQTYVVRRYDMRRASAEEASGWFEARMQELAQQAAQAEAELSAVGTSEPASGGPANTEEVRLQLRNAITGRLSAQSRFDQINLALRSKVPLEVLPQRLATDSFAPLYDAYTATNDVAERQALNAEAMGLMVDLRDDARAALDTAQAQEADARAALSAATGIEPDQSDGGEVSLLESEARIYRQMYETYTTTYLRTKELQTFPTVDASVIAMAEPPEGATGPGGMKLLLVSGLLGLTLGSGIAFAREARDPRLRTRSALSRSVGAPVLGLLPPPEKNVTPNLGPEVSVEAPQVGRVERAQGAVEGTDVLYLVPSHQMAVDALESEMSITLTNPLSIYADTIRRVRVAFDNYFAPNIGKRGSVIGFISEDHGTSRPTAAINYAEMVAVGGQRTLLIDFDWLEAYLSHSITPNAKFGVPDLMFTAGDNFSEELAFWVDERTGLHFVPNRAMSDTDTIGPAVFDSGRLIKLVHELSTKFDLIVIDFPALGSSVNAAALSPVVDGFVCTADWGKSDKKALAKAMATCGVPQEKVVGAIMSGVTEDEIARYEATG